MNIVMAASEAFPFCKTGGLEYEHKISFKRNIFFSHVVKFRFAIHNSKNSLRTCKGRKYGVQI